MRKILFILGDVLPTSAQGERYLQLGKRLAVDAAITFLSHSRIFGAELSSVTSHVVTKPIRSLIIQKVMNKLGRWVFPDWHICHLNKYKRTLRDEITNSKPDVIIIGMTPFSLLMLGKYIKSSIPEAILIGDMSDPFSFNMGLRNRTLLQKLAQFMEAKYFRFYDHIAVLNEQIRQHYTELYPQYSDKFEVIEQGIDEFYVQQVNGLIPEPQAEFTFLYAGAFYQKGRNPRNLYAAVMASAAGIRLQVYGNIKPSLRPPESGKVIFHPAVTKSELVKVTVRANALILFDNDFGYQVPGKTLETLAINKPVLVIYNNANSPTLDYLKETQGTALVKNETESIKAGICRIVKETDVLRNFDYSKYTWDVMVEKYKVLLSS